MHWLMQWYCTFIILYVLEWSLANMRLGLQLLLKVLPVMLLAQTLQFAVNPTRVSEPSMTTFMIS